MFIASIYLKQYNEGVQTMKINESVVIYQKLFEKLISGQYQGESRLVVDVMEFDINGMSVPYIISQN